MHSFERATAGIGFHVNAHKTEYICSIQAGDISTLDGASVKLVDKFSYLGCRFSSTEKNRHAANEGIDCYQLAIDHMEIRPDR